MNSESIAVLRITGSKALGGLLIDPGAAAQHYCFLYFQRQIAVIIQKKKNRDKKGRYRGGTGGGGS